MNTVFKNMCKLNTVIKRMCECEYCILNKTKNAESIGKYGIQRLMILSL
ncbi:hypothetical protein B4102_2139 [Heyndrickxia sporothermodurans]|uniref:Uncharacterized protein n=1 Tax=Heyndrickxia sporothermodurans TaxID=46224 RepID=A0A150LGE5_9BACI|nr:hypothetical protein B4102_2139 [Heyndrickxia sporothermodurans]